MDHRRKIEAAINSFNEKRKKSEEEATLVESTSKNKRCRSLSEACPVNFTNPLKCAVQNSTESLVEKQNLNDKEPRKADVYDEFDQFVVYDGLKKMTQDLGLMESRKETGTIILDSPVLHAPTEIIPSIGNVESVPGDGSIISVALSDRDAHTDNESLAEIIPSIVNVEQSAAGVESIISGVGKLSDRGGQTANEILTEEIDSATSQDYGAASPTVNEVSSNDESVDHDESSDDDDEEYFFPTPDEVKNAKAPQVGMVFSSLKEAVRFVNVYGNLSGFSVIKGRNYKNRKISLMCNKSRKTVSKVIAHRRRRRSIVPKTDCKMKVIVKLVGEKWHITFCAMDHNHDLSFSPSLTKFFLSHRTMSSEEAMLSRFLQDIRVKPQRIMAFFRKMKGSFGNITFGTRKLENLKQAERKDKMNSDIEYTLKYMEKIQLEKPGFCSKMEVDSGGSVRSIFWTDGRSRMDYRLYGEIICFDATYSTNKYNMPFAPIIGVNGHGRTIVFGWALLKDQTQLTFEWLFKSFVEVMEGKKPMLILTDQDVATKLAISKIFPDAWHRFCIWHILKCLRENMSAYMSEREGMEDCIVGLIMESITENEFESGWSEMLITYNSANHEHLKRMWAARTKFVPAYFKRSFCPFTRTTGRSESFNSNFKDYVLRKDTIETFLKQYVIFQEKIQEQENEDRFQSILKTPSFWGHNPIERHAAKIYRRGIYMKFVTEMVNSTSFSVQEVLKDEIYELKKLINYDCPEYRRNLFTVVVDRKNLTFDCECGKYEKDGILCCHILRLFTQFDVVNIPGQYIMARWTSEFREKELLKQKKDTIAMEGSNTAQNALRHAAIIDCVNDVCVDISRDGTKSVLFVEEVLKIHKKLMEPDSELNQKKSDGIVLKDPLVIKKKTATSSADVEL